MGPVTPGAAGGGPAGAQHVAVAGFHRPEPLGGVDVAGGADVVAGHQRHQVAMSGQHVTGPGVADGASQHLGPQGAVEHHRCATLAPEGGPHRDRTGTPPVHQAGHQLGSDDRLVHRQHHGGGGAGPGGGLDPQSQRPAHALRPAVVDQRLGLAQIGGRLHLVGGCAQHRQHRAAAGGFQHGHGPLDEELAGQRHQRLGPAVAASGAGGQHDAGHLAPSGVLRRGGPVGSVHGAEASGRLVAAAARDRR